MSVDDDFTRQLFGVDYDLVRWTDGKRDADDHIIWNESLPRNRDWDRITMVTLDFDPEGEGNYRNIPISPDRPLDPYGSNQPGYRGPHKGGIYGPDYYYDLDDLASNYIWAAFSP